MAGHCRYAIVAHQRTGTHFLAAMLRRSPSIFQYDEVLLPVFEGVYGEFGSFFSYYKKELEADWSKLLITDYNKIDVVFEGFFNHIEEKIEQPVVGIDVKIDQLATFPRLYWKLPELGFKIIHLVRENYLARVVSHNIMNMRVDEGTDLHYKKQRDIRLSLDVNATVDWMQNDLAGNEYIESVMGGAHYHKITYEKLSSSHVQEVVGDITNFLGAEPPSDLIVDTVKQATADLSDTIINYEELVREIERRELTHLLG